MELSVNTLFQLVARIISVFGLVFALEKRIPELVYWIQNGKGFEGPMRDVAVYLGDRWYPSGIVFATLLLVLSPLLGYVLPEEERVPVKMNAFAILTVGLRILAWTSVLHPLSRILVVKLGWLEYGSVEGLTIQAVIGAAVFWFAPQIAHKLLGVNKEEPAELAA